MSKHKVFVKLVLILVSKVIFSCITFVTLCVGNYALVTYFNKGIMTLKPKGQWLCVPSETFYKWTMISK